VSLFKYPCLSVSDPTIDQLPLVSLIIFSTKKSNLIKQALNKYGIEDLFSEIIGGDSIPKKPNAFLFEQILKQYGLEKEEVLLVGDSKIDSLAAMHLFIDFTQIAYFKQEHLPLANTVISSLKELLVDFNL
jgi:phosphoglycolate phosphatase